jgi:hypothetical protein
VEDRREQFVAAMESREDQLGLNVLLRRQGRQVVIGFILRERHIDMIPLSCTNRDALCT